MGAFTSRRNAGVEEVDISTSNAYRYPPKSGCYFGSHFIMGGERFDTTQPENYLFGENQDLNFLGNRPIPFPYPAPQAHEPTKTLKSLVNIRKDSLRFIRLVDDTHTAATAPIPAPPLVPSPPASPSNNASSEEKPDSSSEEAVDATNSTPSVPTRYNIEFTIDSDVRCAITIYYFATEEITNGQVIYHPRDTTMNSETFHYKRGANQTFMQSTHIIDPSKFTEEEWQYNSDKDVIPVVIQCVVEDEVEHAGHSHMTYATVEKGLEGGYSLKPLKQKQMVDGLCYLLQEIYGIENKNLERAKQLQEDEIDDNGSECVICMSDLRDTLILPCRHLCLCNGCADSLRYQANNCPICRAPFRALLQIRAMRKKLPSIQSIQTPPSDSEETAVSQEGVPAGYEAVSLIEALNGPNLPPLPPNPLHMPTEGLPPPMRLPNSLPTSPEESPILDKRKLKRQTSVSSRRSVQETHMLQEADEHQDTIPEGHSTPEIAMATMPPEPIKTSQSPIKINKTRTSSANSLLERKPSKDTVEIVDEVGKNIEKERKKDRIGDRDAHKPTDDDEDVVMEAVVIGATAALAEPISSPSPPPDYEDDFEDDDKSIHTEVMFKPAAHTVVLYDRESLDEEKHDEDPLVTTLPSQVMESISLPGTPVSTTDGSSFSSTGSTRMLLTGVNRSHDEDKPVNL